MIPLAVYVAVDATQIGSAYLSEKRIRSKSKNKQDFFKIKNPSVLSNLGQVRYFFFFIC
jgi:hypothetical protein